MFEPIQTARLTLREWSAQDLPAMRVYAADEAVVRFMPFGQETEEQSEARLATIFASQRASPRTAFDFAVALTSTEEVIGSCDLVLTFSEGIRDAEIGYLYRRSAWGNGYATEAAQAVLRFGFDQAGGHRIFATHDTENSASLRVLEKLGMRQEGLIRGRFNVRGQWRDHYLYAILENEWLVAPR